jgi:hypothetical protein
MPERDVLGRDVLGRDVLGRRRVPGQNRGLRPLYPPLPADVSSRAVRVAMPERAWEGLDDVVSRSTETAPRVIGALLEHALREHRAAEVADWQEWQIRKEQRLLSRVHEQTAAS